jgi:glycosyltransferase involved in cell wall biosynthesis
LSTSLSPDQITIAVTVYDRRQYLLQAVRSALNQTVPVRVMVVEDCGPDPTLQGCVKEQFGSLVEYVHNPRHRGLFGNMNACLELCPTPWLSILHDDDYLAPEFVETMLELHRQFPDGGLYFGGTTMVDENGDSLWEWPSPALPERWRRVTLQDVKWTTPFAFPGQFFKIEDALALNQA